MRRLGAVLSALAIGLYDLLVSAWWVMLVLPGWLW